MKSLVLIVSFLLIPGGAPILHSAESKLEMMHEKAEAGDAETQLELGWMYQTGRGIGQDDAQAVQWYLKAAEQGLASAQCNLGMMYMEGRGVERDAREAVDWFHRAAAQGHASGYYNLGLAYVNGDGVPQDVDEAIRWLLKAAENVDPQTAPGNDGQYKSEEVISWAPGSIARSADRGSVAAQNFLGTLYFQGRSVVQDYAEALKWFRKAALQGHAPAQRNLANMYYNGYGLPKDSAEGLKWFHKAAGNGDPQAQNVLGSVYAMGKGVSRDIVQACSWFILSAASGDKNGLQYRDYLLKRMSVEQISQSEQLAQQKLEVIQEKEAKLYRL